jgi:hypothetical protein
VEEMVLDRGEALVGFDSASLSSHGRAFGREEDGRRKINKRTGTWHM